MATHPIIMVVVTSKDLPASAAFYASVFGWQMHAMGPTLTAAVARGGPAITLRSDAPEGFQGVVPFLATSDVPATLDRVKAAGGAVEREPWQAPMVGTLARFTDPAGTVYGLTSAMPPGAVPRIPAPFGDAPAPPEGSVCSLEMHADDLDAAGRFFGETFGWTTQSMMPQFLSFDPGGGIGGVFQSHTPATRAVAYIYASDVAGMLSKINAAGGKALGDPMAMPGMATFGYFTDPSGTTMGLIGR